MTWLIVVLLPSAMVMLSLVHSSQLPSFANQMMQMNQQQDSSRYESTSSADGDKIAGRVVASLGCNRRLYTYRITQADSMGRECWDHVSVWSCWGRCDSKEISDWKFPYKRSYHPVCMHAGRSKAVAYLRQCHPDVEPETKRYEYLEAIGCHCQVIPVTKK